MKWIEAKVIFDSDNSTIASDLISNIFCELGLQGVVIDEPGIKKSENSLNIPSRHSVSGYFPENESTQKQCRILEDELTDLKNRTNLNYKIVYHKIDEKDWAESWKEHFYPQKISSKIVVKPTWREYKPSEDEIILEIDPGMAFGTGTHATTAMCIRMIEKHLKKNSSFLDIGAGSGILMIAAWKLGAKKVWGVDIDDTAADVAVKNIIQNNIDKKKFRVLTGNLDENISEQFDFITANISSKILVEFTDQILRPLKKNGLIVFSGILEEEEQIMVDRLTDLDMKIIEIESSEGWISIAATF